MVKKNDVITLNIESVSNLGFGVAHVDGLVVFVSGAVTGDKIEGKIIKVTSSYAVGIIEKLIMPSPLRDEGRCDNKKCTSCAYKSLKYEEEKRIKEREVKEAFKKAGLPHIEISTLVSTDNTHFYRNKAQYPVATSKDGKIIIGYYAPKTHRVVEARHCPLTPTIFGNICDTLSEYFTESGASVYDEESGRGLLRHIYLRRGEKSGEILLTLVINGKEMPREDLLISKIREKYESVVGILLNTNEKNTNVILGEKYRTLYGRDYIFDTLAGVELKIKPNAFYQVNHEAAELLYAKARELAKLEKSDTLLDLYCGTGSIGLSMAEDCRELFGVDIVEDAISCAKENAARMGLKNAHFFASNADETEHILDEARLSLKRDIKPDVVILDPPRSGCGEKAVNFVASLSPKRIVYISCNPTTLARDVKIFESLGYQCGTVTPVDLFPATGHVESVVRLERRLDVDMRR